ncbi:BREX-1 system adenine-specific DNA-methyltransferase PglX [Polaribacter sp. Z014]|uniref:Eco57I restriction-modification methylase domain-containing protein n=1 Tax=Polaribacter sp. Z014 TaxID=2927126 RepID=UPI00202004CD|nr:DNA methyltransferase [Polaribacter sp. Z014]MCL7765056.1 BREX-1 system adenine-specific DNA-methyltransferase PglX [Polaribacter sp. Z014]
MKFSSINIQGNIVSSEILDKIRSEEKFKHQSPEAFGLSRTASLRDEIGMSWAIMRTHWQAYKKRLETLPKGDTGTTLTRERLIIPLLSELGYEVHRQNAQIVNGKSYAISHNATNKDQYPIHIMGYNDHLDKRRDSGGPRLSPHALVQEYLNNTEHLYALVTNGKQLRLLRDATRLVRMSYLEFDLERMFEEELYADFSLLFRVLHATRMPDKIDGGSESVIEYYHQESMASGTRIREKLSEAVENSIKTLANGFLENAKNTELVMLFNDNSISSSQYYTHQLRLIYRILFLIVLEERKLIYPDDLTEDQQRLREVYYRYYSIERLRTLTENRVYVDADKYDLWESLKTTFLLFEEEDYGTKLGIKPLGSGLFAPNAIGILKEQFLSNGNLIEVLKRLTTFVNEQKILVRVNYSDLDVEEFGSIYEGLLEYDPKVEKIGSVYQFSFVKGDDRSSSGSHYTPEELVKPLIKHSLDYIIADKLKEENPEEALLSITVCDVACGSGHILLSAARKIATELASIREGAEQPSPTYYRAAMKDVIRNCIYGVDLNPLAVELCKVALWLEAHNPNEPLNFLDHHIKCGNAIVGLAHFEELQNGIATEAFKTLPGDEKEFAATLRKKNTAERKTKQISTFDTEKEDVNLQGIQKEFTTFVQLPETTPEEITAKAAAYKNLTTDEKWYRLKNLADLQVAQFFIPKTVENREKLTTNEKYKTYLNSGAQIIDRGAASAMAVEKRFFHWFLEFPQVFSNEGFDCILGNPPYLGGAKISGHYGRYFLNFLFSSYEGSKGQTDLIAYFYRRIFDILNRKGFQGLITTETISKGDTRSSSLEIILNNFGEIIFAIKSIKWPGEANVQVGLNVISKSKHHDIQKVLNDKNVDFINSFISDQLELKPYKLLFNSNTIFKGTDILGTGFCITQEEKDSILNDKNKSIIFPYINGSDLNNNVDFEGSRWIINFFDWNEKKAKQFPKCYSIIEKRVKPERMLNNREIYKRKWWQYGEKRVGLYSSIKNIDFCFAGAASSKYLNIVRLKSEQVFSNRLFIIAKDGFEFYAIFQSCLKNVWSWEYGAKQGGSTLSYSTKDCFETFPFQYLNNKKIDSFGFLHHEIRSKFMKQYNIGLTEFYNKIHSKIDSNLFVEFLSIQESMDKEILATYGWQDINLRHDFYEVDYLPENDRVRYTIHPEARKEVLKRLLLLNHERFEEEVSKGLHKKKDVVAFYQQKGTEIPENTVFSDGKKKPVKRKKVTKVEEPQAQYGLFNAEVAVVKDGSKVTIKNEDGSLSKYHISKTAVKGKFTEGFKQIATSSTLAEIMLGRKVNDSFSFGGVKYVVLEVI